MNGSEKTPRPPTVREAALEDAEAIYYLARDLGTRGHDSMRFGRALASS